MTAPLQLIGLTFPLGTDAESRLLAEVGRIEGRGVLRVLDMVFVAKGQDGTVEGLEVGDDEDFGNRKGGLRHRSRISIALRNAFRRSLLGSFSYQGLLVPGRRVTPS
jgi:hypothetical protein